MERYEIQSRRNARDKTVREEHFSSPSMSFVAFYDETDRLACALDVTKDELCPDYMLIISPQKLPDGTDEKWDSILKRKFNIDPNSVRPKNNTKYEKIDVAYADLSLYDALLASPTEEIYDEILELRLLLSLESAFAREAEDVLVANIASSTRTKAATAVETLKKSIVRLAKRLQREEGREPQDQQLIEKITQSLYETTEKRKRSERRGKRALKRLESANRDLETRRRQIAMLKSAITHLQESSKIKPLPPPETPSKEKLTSQSINATNHTGAEKKEKTIMAKDDKKTASEFKPPFVDDTAQPAEERKNSSPIRFANAIGFDLGSERTKIWMYAASVIISLILIFGIFYLLRDSNDRELDEPGVVQQTIVEEEIETIPAPIAEPEPEPAPIAEPEPAPRPVPVRPAPPPRPRPAQSKPVHKPAAPPPAPEASRIEEPARPAPVVEEPMPMPVPEEPAIEEETAAESTPEPSEEELASQTADYFEDSPDEPRETAAETEEPATIDAYDLFSIRKDYEENVLAGDNYIAKIEALKNTGFDNANAAVGTMEELRSLNRYWNAFRNATYAEYYAADGDLKDDIDFAQAADDEAALKLYSEAYFQLYEYMTNEFANTYEYAADAGLYGNLEEEIQDAGRPNAKLELIETMYGSVQRAGGTKQILQDIEERYNNYGGAPAVIVAEDDVASAEIEAEAIGDDEQANELTAETTADEEAEEIAGEAMVAEEAVSEDAEAGADADGDVAADGSADIDENAESATGEADEAPITEDDEQEPADVAATEEAVSQPEDDASPEEADTAASEETDAQPEETDSAASEAEDTETAASDVDASPETEAEDTETAEAPPVEGNAGETDEPESPEAVETVVVEEDTITESEPEEEAVAEPAASDDEELLVAEEAVVEEEVEQDDSADEVAEADGNEDTPAEETDADEQDGGDMVETENADDYSEEA